jgi:hypothetical protein
MKLLGISTDDLHNPPMVRAFVTRLTTLLVGIAIAVIVGYWLGAGQTSYLIYFGAVLVVVLVAFGMQRKAWILIPLTFPLTGSIGKLPIPFAVRDLGVLLATTSYVAYRVLSMKNLRPKPHMLDLLVGVNVIYVAFTLFINPVGFLIFGSQTIGGRPIVNICLALLAYWVMIRLPDTVTSVSRIPYYILPSVAVVSVLNLLVFVVPSVTPTVMSWYSGLDISAYTETVNAARVAATGGSFGMVRLKWLSDIGFQLFLVLCAYYSPATLFDPRRGRFYAMLLATVCILAAGFRNLMLWAMATVGIGGWLHRRWRELAVGGFVGALLLLLLAFGQGRFYQLPGTIQRSLSFLPGQWSEAVVADVEVSSAWRFKLWKDVIEWGLIKDWWFGDGFGANLEDAIVLVRGGSNTEFALLSGGLHSGPLSAVRYVGICGLALLYLLSISAAFYSYRCVNECRGTPLFPVAIYFAIQLIWGPIHYAFVFGAYNFYLTELLFQIAYLRLLFRLSDELKQNAAAKTRLAPAQSIAIGSA